MPFEEFYYMKNNFAPVEIQNAPQSQWRLF